jgi:DNA-directed RNA polymerase subunit M/transcription elongation factor TFIIS
MHFCEKCQNMYYLRMSEANENELMYYCRNCGYEDKNLHQDMICVSTEHIQDQSETFDTILNPYVKYDPTLPRVYHISCVNNECQSNKPTSPEQKHILYIRYDEGSMKYIYMCALCDSHWKSDIKK